MREALGIRLDDYKFDEPWLVLDTIIENRAIFRSSAIRFATRAALSRTRHERVSASVGSSCSSRARLPKNARRNAYRELLAPWNAPIGSRSSARQSIGPRARRDNWRWVACAGRDAAHQCRLLRSGSARGYGTQRHRLEDRGRVRGESAEDILDSYQQEREPHVRAIIATAIAMGQLSDARRHAAAGRDREMWRARLQARRTCRSPIRLVDGI